MSELNEQAVERMEAFLHSLEGMIFESVARVVLREMMPPEITIEQINLAVDCLPEPEEANRIAAHIGWRCLTILTGTADLGGGA